MGINKGEEVTRLVDNAGSEYTIKINAYVNNK
jgi:hypothetical protein